MPLCVALAAGSRGLASGNRRWEGEEGDEKWCRRKEKESCDRSLKAEPMARVMRFQGNPQERKVKKTLILCHDGGFPTGFVDLDIGHVRKSSIRRG